jgi:hypothetical protein
MHLASTSAGLFLTGGYPYLRASVGHQINLGEFFEKVGSLLIAFIPQALNRNFTAPRKSTAHAGLRDIRVLLYKRRAKGLRDDYR